MDKNTMDTIHLHPYHTTDITDLKINGENVSSISENTNNIIYVSKDGNDETGNGSLGNPFLTIGHANDYAISMVNPVVDWDELVVVKVSPGKYTEHLTVAHQRVLIEGIADPEHWMDGVIIYNTGADEAHYPIGVTGRLLMMGIQVQVDSGGVYGKIPERLICHKCSFYGGEFLEDLSCIVRAYFNFCYFNGVTLNFTGVANYSRFIAFRYCDIQSSSDFLVASTGTGTKTIKLEYTKVDQNIKINGNWSLLISWAELYGSNGKITFDTDGYIDIFASIIVNGIHFYSDTPLTKKLVNCIFKETPDSEGDVTADEAVEFIEYSGNHQDHGIDGEVITVSKIKNVGGGQNMYRNIHEALKGSILQDTIINLEGDVEIDSPLIINPNIDVQIDGNKKWKLTTTHATTLCELGANQQLSFVNLKQILGGKKAIINGNNANLSFVSCGRYTQPNYVNIEINAGNAASFVYSVKSTIIATGVPAILINDTDVWLIIDRSFIKGSSGEPAIEWTVDADSRLRCKTSTLLHGDGAGNSPLLNSDPGNGDITFSIYNTSFNASYPTSDFTNSINSVNANLTVDAGIDF